MCILIKTIFTAALATCCLFPNLISAQETKGAIKAEETQKFFLQRSRPAVDWAPGSMETRTGLNAGGPHAEFAFDRDRIADTEVGNVKVGFAYALGEVDFVKLNNRSNDHWVLPVAFAWADFDGTFDGSKGNKTKFRFGLQADWLKSGGLFDSQQVSVAPYYMTDMHFNAKGYGVDVTWQPVRIPRLRRNLKSGSVSIDGGLNALHVDESGETGLASGTDYLWVSATIEGRYDFLKETLSNPPSLTGEFVIAHDLVSGRTEELTKIGLEIPLVESNDIKLRLDHTFGREFSKLEDKDETQLKLLFRF